MKSIAIRRSNQLSGKHKFYLGSVLTLAFLIVQAGLSHARGAPDSFADLAERLLPSVVNITTSQTVTGVARPNAPQVPEGSPFRDLFPDLFGDQGGNGRARKASALGSGFVVSADGLIVTNNHVIDKADEITIEFYDGKKLDATLLGRDVKTDIALLKVETDEPLPFVGFGDSDVSRVGDWVMAIGNPLGQGFTVTSGIISARNKSLRGTYDDFIQTDAAINRGNSGGPLFNMDGDVIGVNTAIISPSGGSIGLGFSMSSNVVTKVVNQLEEFGETRRGWLGVRIQDVDAEMAEGLGLEGAKGALVSGVPDGPGKDAGILPRDVILSFDGEEIDNTRELVRVVGNADVGKAVRMVVFRDGKTMTLKVVLGRREDAEKTSIVPAVAEKPAETKEAEALGMRLTGVTDELRERLNLDASTVGVAVIFVEETADAYEKGIRSGDVITEVGQKAVTSAAELQTAFKEARDAGRKSVLLLVERAGNPRFVGLALD